MKTLALLAASALLLASCSSEPSDWRPDDKVSTDMVDPGTRASEQFGSKEAGHDGHAATEAVGTPPTTNVNLEDKPLVPAARAITANAEKGLRKKGLLNDAGRSSQSDTTEGGHEVQR